MKNRFIRFAFVVFLSSLTTFLVASNANGTDNNSTKKDKMSAQEYLTKIRNNQITGQLPISDVLNARNASNLMMQQKAAVSNYSWTSMGPNNMAGPSKAVIFDNRDATNNTLYAGSNNGGIWKSTNYAATWSKVEMDNVLNVSTITQADDGTIYVGTGVSLEPASDKISEGSTIGKGVWKSSGDSFVLMEGTAPTGTDVSEEWAFIQKLATDGNSLFAATNTGLKYFDGSTWSYARSNEVDLIGKSCDVVIEDGIIIAAVAGNTYISTGSSSEFALKSGEEDGMLPTGEFGNIKFAISKSNSDYIYASYVDTDGALYNVYVSTDKGNSWRVVYPGGSSLEDIFNGEGLRNNSITVHPTIEKTVYLGAYNVFVGYEAQSTGYYNWTQLSNGNFDPYPIMGTSTYIHFGINAIVFNPSTPGHAITCSDGGLTITKDNFESQQIVNRGFVTTEFYTVNASKAGDLIAGAQFNGVQGIYDNGSNQAFELLKNLYGGPSALTGGHAHVSYINPEFIVASASDGTFWRSEDLGENVSFDILEGVSTGSEFITPFAMWEDNNLEYKYDTAEFAAYRDYEAGSEIWVASNSYDFPFKVTLETKLDSAESRLFMDEVGSRAFIAVEGEEGKNDFDGGVYMTLGMLDYTAAPTWWQIGAVEGIPTCLDYSSDVNYVWVGTMEGRLFRLSNVARATNEEKADINSPGCIIAITEIDLGVSQAITSVAIDPDNSENVIVTLGNYGNDNYVMITTDGQSDNPEFNSIQGNLPKMPVYASTFVLNSDVAFIGTENGLFYTTDVLADVVEWNYEETAFGDVPVFALKQQDIRWPAISYTVGETVFSYPGATNYGAVYVGTFGNGAYVSRDFVGFEEFENKPESVSNLSVYPNPAFDHIKLALNANYTGSVSIEIFDLSGKLVLSAQENVRQGNNIIPMDTYQIENGSYIIRVNNGEQVAQTKLIISK